MQSQLFVPSNSRVGIKPSMINIAARPCGMVLLGTLGTREFEEIAAQFVEYGQRENDRWHGFYSKIRQGAIFTKMAQEGFLIEALTDEGWYYELSHFAIETIYVVQTGIDLEDCMSRIRRLQEEVREAHGITFWDRLEKLFMSPPKWPEATAR